MIGGGTAYAVRFLTKDKPTHPLHNGHTYATTILSDGHEFFEVRDAIDYRAHWEHECGMEKYELGNKLQKVADRLAIRIAKRAYPELKGAKSLPFLWAGYTLPILNKTVPVRMALPE